MAEFLIQAYDGGLEGTLLLQTAEREKSALWFTRGAPAKARLFDRSITLRQVVVDLGLVDPALADSSQKQAQAERRLHGELLLERGYVDQTGLYVALREQLVRQTLALCELADTTGYGFYKENFLENWGHEGQWRVKPLRLMWRATVDHLPPARRAAWLAKLGDASLRLRRDAPVARYGPTKPELAVIDMMRARQGTILDLLGSGVGNEVTVQKVVCSLMLTRQLDLGFKQDPVGLHEPPETPQSIPPPEARAARRSPTVPRPSGLPDDFDSSPSSAASPPHSSSPTFQRPQPAHPAGSPGPNAPARRSATRPSTTENAIARHSITAPATTVTVSEAPPPSQSPEAAPLAPEVAALAAAIAHYQDHPPRNYYEVLGLERGADGAQVRTAFFQLARKWHPDRLPPELAHLRGIVNRAFSEIGEAHQTLIDDAKRAEYERGLGQVSDDEQQQVASILRAASAHQRAEILYKKKSYQEAFVEAKAAFDADPSQPDYVALYAWLHTLVCPTEKHQIELNLISATLEKNPNHIQALWYRGQLYKKLQQTSKAMRDFKHIVNLKPSHVDAAREVRVHKMRRQSDPRGGSGTPPRPAGNSPRPSGLFGAFRKKS